MAVIKLKPLKEPSTRTAEFPHLVMVQSMIPNLITLTAMGAGISSIQHALHMDWDKAILAMLIATILDTLDGATARLLKATSDFGAYLDTLSDFLAFGIAPAVILYIWSLEASGKIGWIAMLFYISATALRLARFNTEQKDPTVKSAFFTGVPSPAGAGLAMLPIILWMQQPAFFAQFAAATPLISLWTVCVAALMISRIPTFSVKAIRVPAKAVMPVMALAALVIAALFTVPWQTLTALGLLYIASIPVAALQHRKSKKSDE